MQSREQENPSKTWASLEIPKIKRHREVNMGTPQLLQSAMPQARRSVPDLDITIS